MHLEVDGQALPFDLPPRRCSTSRARRRSSAPPPSGSSAAACDPGQTRDVEVLRVRSDRSVRRLQGRCLWLGGRDWRLLLPLESTGFSVRADGTVAGVEAAAMLVE